MNSGEKECPFCFEVINARAIRCKHCHADLSVPPSGMALLEAGAGAFPPEAMIHPGTHVPLASNSEIIAGCDVAETLAHLVDKSLVVFDEATGRYRLLETVRQYARDRLVESASEDEETRCIRHFNYFLALAEETSENSYSAEAPGKLDKMEAEHDNCRAALDFCEAHLNAERHLRLTAAIGWFWYIRGYYREGRSRVGVALSRPDHLETTTPRAKSMPWLRGFGWASGVASRCMAAIISPSG